jgi:hypothetical protein
MLPMGAKDFGTCAAPVVWLPARTTADEAISNMSVTRTNSRLVRIFGSSALSSSIHKFDDEFI